MRIEKAGLYYGKPIEWTVEANRTSGLPQFVVKFELVFMFENKEWVPSSTEIIGYFYPVKRDGSRNDTTVEMLSKVFGWDGLSFDTLQDTDYSAVECQVDVREDTWNGQTKLKVAFVNPAEYTPQPLKKAEAAKVNSLQERFGSVLKGGKVAMPAATRPLPPKIGGARPSPTAQAELLKDENIPF